MGVSACLSYTNKNESVKFGRRNATTRVSDAGEYSSIWRSTSAAQKNLWRR